MAVPYRVKLGGRTLKLPEGESDVGRSPDCWLIVEDDLTSRAHARFHVGPGSVELEDLESRNGTFVNGEQIEGRVRLHDGDRIRIGRENLTFVGDPDDEQADVDDRLRRTIGPGEDSKFPSLIGALVEKSLSMGKVKEAERYALALTNQLAAAREVAVDHPTAASAVSSLIALGEKSGDGVWLDRVFKLHASKGWVMEAEVVTRIREALDRIPRVPGTGLSEYDKTLRALAREGVEVPPRVLAAISELADAYA